MLMRCRRWNKLKVFLSFLFSELTVDERERDCGNIRRTYGHDNSVISEIKLMAYAILYTVMRVLCLCDGIVTWEYT